MQKDNITQERLGLALLWLVPVVLIAAATYELAMAVGLVAYAGGGHGRNIAPADPVTPVASLMMLLGAALAVVHVSRPWAPSAVALYAPAAAAFMVASFYTYDPYYLPTLERYSDGGTGGTPASWIFVVLAVSLAVGVLAHLHPRAGSIATAPTLFLVLVSVSFLGYGH
ncbi:MAG: hypothetical protein ACRDMH_01045 [Solirubrobacterales bacterium]